MCYLVLDAQFLRRFYLNCIHFSFGICSYLISVFMRPLSSLFASSTGKYVFQGAKDAL